MKFYESHYEEYIKSVENYNIHNELIPIYDKFPKNICDFENLIIYGSPGIGKYSQLLYLLKKYSPSELKYEKKITVKTEKQEYNYHISDIHYEIDMGFLGCNSKILWHEIYFQIVDIVSVKPDKIGIIVCKNFHKINSELLDIFYSYIQHYNTKITNIQIKFILMTEHVSFIPTKILNVFHIIGIKRPFKEDYKKIILDKDTDYKNNNIKKYKNINNMLEMIDSENIINIKELNSFSEIKFKNEIPKDIFNIICNKIIDDINNHNGQDFLKFRDSLYDILVYNLDMTECLYYILSNFIETGQLKQSDISDILIKSYIFLKYYNNNYRPIYHLESIMYYIIIKIYNYEHESSIKSIKHTRK
jgi:hypothetical protein